MCPRAMETSCSLRRSRRCSSTNCQTCSCRSRVVGAAWGRRTLCLRMRARTCFEGRSKPHGGCAWRLTRRMESVQLEKRHGAECEAERLRRHPQNLPPSGEAGQANRCARKAALTPNRGAVERKSAQLVASLQGKRLGARQPGRRRELRAEAFSIWSLLGGCRWLFLRKNRSVVTHLPSAGEPPF